jgi:hypothetical protein
VGKDRRQAQPSLGLRMHRARISNARGSFADWLGELMFKRLGGPIKKVEKSSLQKTKNIRKSSQIEATTAETKNKNRNKKI